MEKVKISDIYFFQEGPGVRKWQFTESGVKLLNVGNINGGQINLDKTSIYISEEEAYGKYSHFLVHEGDLLIACLGIVVDNFHNKIAFIEKEHLPVCLNTSTMRFKELPAKKGTLNYLKFFLQTNNFKEQLRKLITGSAQLNFGPSHIKKIDIPLPPLSIQKTIAAKLDKAQEIIAYNKQLLEKYDQLTQALFIDMFGDPVKNEKGWEKDVLGNVCIKITDGTHDTPERLKEGIKFITGKHIRPFFIDYENSDYVTEEIHKEIFRRCNPEKYDILYTNIGVNYGTAAMNIVDFEFSMKNVALLKYDRNILIGQFLTFILNNENFKDRLKTTFGIGGAQQFLSLSNIKKIQVLLPPIHLQNQFAERVEKIEIQKQMAQESLAKSEELFQSLLKESFK